MKKTERKSEASVIDLLKAGCSTSGKTLAGVLTTEGLGMSEMAAAIMSGETLFPIEWLKPVAKALDIDPAFFLHVYMRDYFLPQYLLMFEFIEGEPYTANEKKLVASFRSMTQKLEGKAVVVDPKRIVGVVLI